MKMIKIKLVAFRDDLKSDDFAVKAEIVDKKKHEMPAESILLDILHDLLKERKEG